MPLSLAFLGPLAIGAPVFSPAPYDAPHAVISVIVNPLVTAEYKATPDYTYLYIPSLTYGSPPRIVRYRYAADHSYLLRPSSGSGAVAAAYRWKYCIPIASPGPAASGAWARATHGIAPLDRPAVARERGQKIDNALKPDAMIPPGRNASWRASASLANLRLAETVPLSPVGVPRSNGACLLSE
jgi:hypothetical protein